MTPHPPRGTGPIYYRSFAAYPIPFRPEERIAFADTEGLSAFFAAYYDAEQRLVTFEKLQCVREGSSAFTTGIALVVGSPVYFEVSRDPVHPVPGVGTRIEYRRTEHLVEYYSGRVDRADETQSSGRADLYRRDVMFSDVYEYWPGTNRLRTRTLTRSGQPVLSWEYGENGRPIPRGPKAGAVSG